MVFSSINYTGSNILLTYSIGLIFFIIVFIKYKTTELVITNKKLIAKVGFIRRKTIELLLNKTMSIVAKDY